MMIIVLHWYVFFYMVKQDTCSIDDPYCNKVNQNWFLIIFYLVVCVYLGF
jgi:hypothetical protein